MSGKKARSGSEDRDLGLKAILAEMNAHSYVTVDVGVLEGKKNSEGVNIAEYGAYNEFGTKDIPERSFMRSTFDENMKRYQGLMAYRVRRIGMGKLTLNGMLNYMGMVVQNDVQEKIRSGIAPSNAPSTIRKKKSNKTLIDTGALIQSITYEITKK